MTAEKLSSLPALLKKLLRPTNYSPLTIKNYVIIIVESNIYTKA